jgi:hypothetical protein
MGLDRYRLHTKLAAKLLEATTVALRVESRFRR